MKHRNSSKPFAVRGAFFHLVADPFVEVEKKSFQYVPDGLMVIENGAIAAFGAYRDIRKRFPRLRAVEYKDALICPGFIDTHIHYPQTEMIASFGKHLLEWLNTYTYPTEEKFRNKSYAQKTARLFLKELLRNGTTTALVFGTVHKQSVDAFFTEAQRLSLRMICGKVLMDRNAPKELRDSPQSGYQDSKELIKKWHNKGRLQYAITPRFALTSTASQLKKAGELAREFPDVFIHTHLCETQDEIKSVMNLFPKHKDYLSIYESYGLVRERSIFAHGVYLSKSEAKRLAQKKAAIAFCPTSNLFLGSGLFDLSIFTRLKIQFNLGLGTDVGAGTTFSMLQTMAEAYKVCQTKQVPLSTIQAFYLATLGGARALALDHKIGNFTVGKDADFVVLNLKARPLITYRIAHARSVYEKLFSLMIMGDDRAIKATYSGGRRVY